jgi:hypothetical protein
MKRSFASELENVKEKYETSCSLIEAASSNIQNLFSGKMVKLKSRITKYFAEVDIQVQLCNREVLEISKIV